MKTKQNLKVSWWNFLIIIISITVLWTPNLVNSQAKPITLKFSHQFPQQDGLSIAATYWADLIEKRTEGRVKFQHFYASSLVKPPQVFDALRMGVTDAGWAAISFMTGKVPDTAVLELQDAIPIDKLVEVYEKIGPILAEIFEKNGIKYLWGPYQGVQLYVAKNKFLKSTADFKGVKMRAAGLGIVKSFELWGASPLFLDVTELYTALQRGTVDGANMLYTITKSLKIYEVAPYITDCGWYVSNFVYVAINMDRWNSISKGDQKIMIEAGHEALLNSYKFVMKLDSDIKNEFKAMKDVHIFDMPNEDGFRLLKMTAPLWDEVRKKAGPLGNQMIDILLKYRRW